MCPGDLHHKAQAKLAGRADELLLKIVTIPRERFFNVPSNPTVFQFRNIANMP
jgi:hypothetical protein